MQQNDNVINDIIPLYRKLASDDQDSVRLLTIPDLIAIASGLSEAETKQHLLDTLRASVQDKSWRVRYMVANEFVALAEAVGQGIVREELVGAFVNLLKDNEAEVRTAGAGQIPGELNESECLAHPLTCRLCQAGRPRSHPRQDPPLRQGPSHRLEPACSSRPRHADLRPSSPPR